MRKTMTAEKIKTVSYYMPTIAHSKEIRQILKESGFKVSVSKKKHYIYVGQQTKRFSVIDALKIINIVKDLGYCIDQEDVVSELARKGLFDTMMVRKLVN